MRYLPKSPAERQQMLAAIGAASIDDLFACLLYTSYVLNHIPKMLAGMAAGLFFVFWASAAFAAWLARRFGARWQLSGGEAGIPALASRQGFLVLLLSLIHI